MERQQQRPVLGVSGQSGELWGSPSAPHDPETFAAPANGLERRLPHGALLRRAACVVCNGGMGITCLPPDALSADALRSAVQDVKPAA